MLIEHLRRGTPVFKTDESGLIDTVEWNPPTRLMLQAAKALERNDQIINGFVNAMQTAERMFVEQRETILRQNLIIQDLQTQLNSNGRGDSAQAPGNS